MPFKENPLDLFCINKPLSEVSYIQQQENVAVFVTARYVVWTECNHLPHIQQFLVTVML